MIKAAEVLRSCGVEGSVATNLPNEPKRVSVGSVKITVHLRFTKRDIHDR
jgi:hypothetical protein